MSLSCKTITHEPILCWVSADFLSPTKNGLVWGVSRHTKAKSDFVGGRLNMFDLRLPDRHFMWWFPTIYDSFLKSHMLNSSKLGDKKIG